MQAIKQGDQSSELHAVRSKKKANTLIASKQPSSTKMTRSSNTFKPHGSSTSKPKFKFKYSGCFRCGNKHDVDATCPAIHAKCQYCKKVGHFQKVCMKKRLKQVNEIVQSPDYSGQDIHLHDDGEDETSDSCDSSSDSDSCTFNTPFGRYRFKRLPFGVVVSQDIFQRKLDDIYRNIPNVTGIADDIIIYGSTEEEHDQAFVNMLEATRANNVSLNSAKLQFKQPSVNFYGHTLTQEGICPAADKLEAIKNISAPSNTKELLSLLGLITYLNRFSAKIAELTAPLRELTKKNIHFRWELHHQTALDKIKKELCSAQVLSYYDSYPATTTILQCNASQEGLGAWIRQVDADGNERIVAMASRSLTDAESRYSNIERECLAVMFGLEKFEYYLLGRHTLVETDHSPLEQIFKKNIAEAPARLQRLLLRCMRFDVEVRYRRGETIPVADALSRVCFKKGIHELGSQESESCAPGYSIHFVTDKSCPISMDSVKSAIRKNPTLYLLRDTIYNGWPSYRKQCPEQLWDYWNFRCDLLLEDGLILKGDRVVIPESLRAQVLESTHWSSRRN